jgi:(S)-citramalyl-CoA lyase
LDTRYGIADIGTLLDSDAEPDFLVLPKAETAGHLQILDRLLTASGKATKLIGIIESARGLADLESVASATPRLVGLMLGAADMAADLGSTTAWEPLAFARGRLISVCSLRGLLPIDAPFFDIHDAYRLKEEVARSVAFGFTAKAAIHPGQVGEINDALTPTQEAITEARAVLAENGKGVGVVDGQMIDEAVARRARRVLAAAGLAHGSSNGTNLS